MGTVSPNRETAWPVRSVRLGLMLRLIMPSPEICGVTLSTTPSVIACGSTVVCRIRPVATSTCEVVLKKTSWVPTRMIAGSLFSAFTCGVATTFTRPCVANAFNSPVKSLMFNAAVNVPAAPTGTRFCVTETLLPAR